MQVYVAVYSHKYGEDVSVYRTSKGADAWRIQLADDYWFDALPDDERPDDKQKLAQMYWDYMRDRGEEWFSVTQCELED